MQAAARREDAESLQQGWMDGPHLERTWIFRGVEQTFRALRRYHRHAVCGLEHIPRTGPAVLASNHSFAVYDSFLLGVPILDELGRNVHGLADRAIFKTPVLRRLFRETGFVPGSRDAAVSFLREGHLVGVMPGGMRESLLLTRRKYEVDWWGRYGFVRVAMLAGAPILLVAGPRGDDIYDVYANPATRWVYERFRLPVPLARGWGPTLAPRPVQLLQLVSEPIVQDVAPDQLRDRDVIAHHARVSARMEQLMKEALRLEDGRAPASVGSSAPRAASRARRRVPGRGRIPR